MSRARLPTSLVDLLDGTELDRKVGWTIPVTATADDGRPRQALLSVGEVLAVDDRQLRLALYGGSRTTAAIAASGRALLTVVLDGQVHKVSVDVEEIGDGGRLRTFQAVVVEVDVDTVPYAEVLHGIEYRLLDPAPVLARWRAQLDELRELRA